MNQSKEIVVTASELTNMGDSTVFVGLLMIMIAGIKIWFMGIGIWSFLIVLVGAYFCYAGTKVAQPGYDALSKAVKDNSK
jgi:hypothetical protein